jgi:hypothetical protein
MRAVGHGEPQRRCVDAIDGTAPDAVADLPSGPSWGSPTGHHGGSLGAPALRGDSVHWQA